jgi:ATP-dependent Clp protease ATP-binding subunit ClpC
MYEMFTERARIVFQLANQVAQRYNAESIEPEHVLLGLAMEGSGVGATKLKIFGVDAKKLREAIEANPRPKSDILQIRRMNNSQKTMEVVTRANAEAKRFGHNYVGTEHLLLALIDNPDSPAYKAVESCGARCEEVRDEILDIFS